MPVKEGVAGAIQYRLGLRQPQTEYLSAPKGMSPKKYVPIKMDVLPIGKLSLSVPESEMSEKKPEGKIARTELVRKVAVRFVRMAGLTKGGGAAKRESIKGKRASLKPDRDSEVQAQSAFMTEVYVSIMIFHSPLENIRKLTYSFANSNVSMRI